VCRALLRFVAEECLVLLPCRLRLLCVLEGGLPHASSSSRFAVCVCVCDACARLGGARGGGDVGVDIRMCV